MLDRLADLVTKRRGAVLSSLLILTILLGFQIPKIQVDPAPESLLSSFDGHDHITQRNFEKWFGADSKIVVLLVEAPDVLARIPLQHVHDLSLHFRKQDWVERVESLTVMNLPRRIAQADAEEDEDDEITLDDIDALEEEWDQETQDDFEEDVFNALLDIIESDPQRFPGGIDEIGPALANELKTDPIVQGTEVTEEEAATLSETVRASPLLMGRIVSEDRTLAAVALHIEEMNSREMREKMELLRQELAKHETQGDVKIYVGGLPYLRSTIVENMRTDNLVLVPITLLVCIILLFISFRWLPGVVLPIGAVAITAIMVVGAMATFGEPMNILNNTIVPLLIIIGISDSIHLIGRYREEITHTQDPENAGYRTVRAMALACLLTSVTTSVGLASLVVSRTVMLRHFGVTAGIGVLIAYLVTITFLPSILTKSKPPDKDTTKNWDEWLERVIMQLTTWVLDHAKFVIACTTVLMFACIYVASQVKVDHALLDQFDESDPVHTTTKLLEDKLDGVRPLEVLISANEPGAIARPEAVDAIDEIKDWTRERREVIRTLSFDDVLREAFVLIAKDGKVRGEAFKSPTQIKALATIVSQREPSPLNSWLTEDARHARLQIKLRDVGAQQSIVLINDLEKELASVFKPAGLSFALTGDAYTGSRGQEAVVRDLLGSLFTAVIIIFILLVILFRSVRLGLLSIPPNIIPLIGAMAYMVGRNIPLNVSTVIIFSISLGLAVDGSIHVLARFREETRRGLRSNAALIRAARGTGRAIVVSAVVLMGGFGVMLLSSFVPVRHFGELIAVTVGCMLVATLIVQPALLKVAGLSRAQQAQLREEDALIASALKNAPCDAEES